MASNVLTQTIQQFDDLDQTLSRRVATITDAAPDCGEYRGKGILTVTTEVAIGLPIAQVRQVYIRNTSVSAKIVVKWTPNGGVSVTVGLLGPGDSISYWNQSTGSTYGISDLSLTADIADTTYEMFLGG